MVAPPSDDGPVPVDEPSTESEGSIYLKQEGKVYLVQGWQTLSQWIEESRIGPEDLISEGGVRWEHVNERPEVAHLFAPDAVAAGPVDADALPFDAAPEPESSMAEELPVQAENRFGGVPTGLPPLPVLSAASLGASVSEAAASPDTAPGEETIDDSQDEVDVLGHLNDNAFADSIDDDELGDQGLTEELLLDETPILEPRSEEPEPAVPEEVVEDPPSDISTLDEDKLFAEFDSKKTVEPAPTSAEDWAEPEPGSPWPWLIAVAVTVVALIGVGWWMLSMNAGTPTEDVELGSALTAAPVPAATPEPITPVDAGTDSDSDADSGQADADSDSASADGTDVQMAAVEPVAEPVPVAPEPIAVVPEPAVAPAPVAVVQPSPQPAPAPAARSVSSMIDAGWSKVDSGNLSGAASEFQAALADQPSNGGANLGYGYVLVEQGRQTQAVRYLCTARDNASGSTAAEARGILTRLELTCD